MKGFKEKGVRLNINKCIFLTKEAEYCGRVINEQGWRYRDEFFNKILSIQRPLFCHEMAQAMYVINWIGLSIPELSKLREPFKEFINLHGKKLSVLKKVVSYHWQS